MQKIFSWTVTTPLLPITVLLIPVFLKFSESGVSPDLLTIRPVYSIILNFLLLFSIVFLIFWSVGVPPYERILNFIYFVFLIGWFYNITVITHYIRRKYEVKIEKLPKYAYVISFVMIALFLLMKNNITIAYSDLLGGVASKYNNEMIARFDFITQNSSDSIEVDSIKNIPGAFRIYDNIADPNHFFNEGYELYFNKKSVTLKKYK